MIQELESLGSIGGAVAAAALLFAAAYCVGGVTVRRNAASSFAAIDVRLVRIAVGLSLIGAIGVTLGTAKCLGGDRSVWLLAVLSSLNVLDLIGRAKRPIVRLRLTRPRRFSWLIVPSIALAVVTLGPALAYPTGWDELVYHSVLPRRWLADGWPVFYADLPFSGFPSLGEVLFWLVAPIESVVTPRLIIWVCWMLGLVMVYRLLRRRLAVSSAATLTLSFAASETALLISANCYVETIMVMNVAALLLWIELRERERTLVARCRNAGILGVLAAGAAAVKLTGLAVLIVPCLWYAVRQWRERPFRVAASVFAYLALALAVALPFYFRTWRLTGDPFYPYYCQWFSADPARLEMSRYHHALGAAFGLHSSAAFLATPILLAYDSSIYDGSFGWQLLIVIALAVLAIVAARKSSRLRSFVLWPAATATWFYFFWFFTAQQARFAVPAMVPTLSLAAMGLRGFRGNQRKLVLAALFAATSISLPWRTAGQYFGSWLCDLGFISRTDYVNVSTDKEYLPLVQALIDHTPADAKLMLLFEHRALYLPRASVIGTPFFQEGGFTPPEQFDDADKMMEILAREGISHLIMTNKPTGPDKLPRWLNRLEPLFAALRQCVDQGRLRVVWESERYVLLEVR